jgi:hypothetical protein
VHVETAAWLRKQFQQPRAVGAAAAGDDLARDLSDYDRAFGLNDGGINEGINGGSADGRREERWKDCCKH